LKVPKLKYKFLKKENDLNKVIKDQRKSGKKTYLLFVSLWDDLSSELVSKVTETYNDEEGKIPLYIIDSYNMPHSFVIYKTTKVPQLVILNKKNIYSDDYLSNIYNNLGLR
tara:strand:- start:463 stop:795 length:333 start_codon:yes stop_codon:yes gene_type:complete